MAYQKKLDEKAREELDTRMREFRESEALKIRIEERDKLRREFTTYRNELEAQLNKRGQELSAREKASEALMKERHEREEREIFQQRQKLLDEMKQLRERESDFKRSILTHTKSDETSTSRLERLEEELKRKEEKLRQAELDLETRFRGKKTILYFKNSLLKKVVYFFINKDERERIKIDLERTYSQRELILETTEARLKQDASQMTTERSQIDSLKHEYQTQLMRLSEIDLELQKCRGENACLRQENVLLKENIQKTLDYDFIKQENRELRQKLELSKV